MAQEKKKLRLPSRLKGVFTPGPDTEIEWIDESEQEPLPEGFTRPSPEESIRILERDKQQTKLPPVVPGARAEQIGPSEFNVSLSSSDQPPSMKDYWRQMNAPIVDIRGGNPQLQLATEQFAQDYPMLGGGLNLVTDALSSQTSPLNLATMGAGAGARIASDIGLPTVARGLDVGFRGLGGLSAMGGLQDIYSGGSAAERIGGLLTAVGGTAGARSGALVPGDVFPNQQTVRGIPASMNVGGGAIQSVRPIPQAVQGIQNFTPFKNLMYKMQEKDAINKGILPAPTARTPKTTGIAGHSEQMREYGLKPAATKSLIELDRSDANKLADYLNKAAIPGFQGPFTRMFATEGLNRFLMGKPVSAAQYQLLGRAFGQNFVDLAKAINTQGKTSTFLNEALNFPRAMKSSLDLSAPLRQGAPMLFNREFWTSLDDMIKSAGSQKLYDQMNEVMMADPEFPKAALSGLAITDRLGGAEEAFISTWAERLPGIGRMVQASERGYVAFLNKLRFDTFKSMTRDLEKMGIDTNSPEAMGFLRENSELINNLTGRSNYTIRDSPLLTFGKNIYNRTKGTPLKEYTRVPSSAYEGRSLGNAANFTFYSPRFQYSRVKAMNDMFNPLSYAVANPIARQQQLKSAAAMTSLWMTTAGLASLAGADISFDPTNSDFLKIRFGDFRMEPTAGMQGYMVVFGREIMNQQTSPTTGRLTALGSRYGAPTRLDVIERFAANKLNPPLKFAYDFLSANNRYPFDGRMETLDLVTPMIISDFKDIYQEDPAYFIWAPLIISGMGSQVFGAGTTY
jgi:hypothetical protein